jgi:multidrug efflux system membrane fusion protein
MRFAGVLIPAVLAGSVLASSCAGADPAGTTTEARAPAGPPPVPVSVSTVAQRAMPLELRVIGRADATNVSVRSQITGELESINFKEGDDVVKGQVLFQIDKRPLEAALRQAEANLERDVAQAQHASAQARRYDDLANRGIATREQVETSQTNLEALQANVGANRAAVENAKLQLQYATIVAPTSGRTGELVVYPGNIVRALDERPLVVINKVSPIDVAFGIPEAQLPILRRFMAQGPLRVEATASDAETEPSVGRIAFIDNTVDSTTGLIKIKGTFGNEDRRLWPGQFLNVTVRLTTESAATIVPTAAVQTGPEGQYVFVVTPDDTVEMRPIVVARTAGAESVITNGVKPGETVVTDGHLRLVPGGRITMKDPALKVEQ